VIQHTRECLLFFFFLTNGKPSKSFGRKTSLTTRRFFPGRLTAILAVRRKVLLFNNFLVFLPDGFFRDQKKKGLPNVIVQFSFSFLSSPLSLK